MQEVGLSPACRGAVAAHPKFFATAKRRGAPAKPAGEDETADSVLLKLIAVVAQADGSDLEASLRSSVKDAADGDSEPMMPLGERRRLNTGSRTRAHLHPEGLTNGQDSIGRRVRLGSSNRGSRGQYGTAFSISRSDRMQPLTVPTPIANNRRSETKSGRGRNASGRMQTSDPGRPHGGEMVRASGVRSRLRLFPWVARRSKQRSELVSRCTGPRISSGATEYGQASSVCNPTRDKYKWKPWYPLSTAVLNQWTPRDKFATSFARRNDQPGGDCSTYRNQRPQNIRRTVSCKMRRLRVEA